MFDRFDAKERADAAEPAEPIERTEQAEPTDPIESTEPSLAIERIEPEDPRDQREELTVRATLLNRLGTRRPSEGLRLALGLGSDDERRQTGGRNARSPKPLRA